MMNHGAIFGRPRGSTVHSLGPKLGLPAPQSSARGVPSGPREFPLRPDGTSSPPAEGGREREAELRESACPSRAWERGKSPHRMPRRDGQGRGDRTRPASLRSPSGSLRRAESVPSDPISTWAHNSAKPGFASTARQAGRPTRRKDWARGDNSCNSQTPPSGVWWLRTSGFCVQMDGEDGKRFGRDISRRRVRRFKFF